MRIGERKERKKERENKERKKKERERERKKEWLDEVREGLRRKKTDRRKFVRFRQEWRKILQLAKIHIEL